MTNELTTLSPSTMRSRRLLRFGVDWRIYLVFPQISSEQLCLFLGGDCAALPGHRDHPSMSEKKKEEMTCMVTSFGRHADVRPFELHVNTGDTSE